MPPIVNAGLIRTKHIAFLALILLGFYVGVNSMSISYSAHEVFNSIYSTILTLLTGIAVFLLYKFSKKEQLAISKTLLWLSISFTSWFIADCLWLWLIAINEYPFPSLADLFYFGMYPAFIVSIFGIPNTTSPSRGIVRIIIEVSILILTAIIFFLFFIAIPDQKFKETDHFSLFITYLYPVLDITIIWIVLIKYFSNQIKSCRKIILYFIIGIISFTISDLMYFIDSLYGINDPGYFIDLGYYLFYFIIVATSLIASKEVLVKVDMSSETNTPLKPSKWLTFLPAIFLVSIVGFFLFFVFDLLNITNIIASSIIAIIFILFIFHQYIVVKENDDLNQEMSRVNIELEKKVLQRTSELNRINKELHEEIIYRKKTEEILKQSDERYRLIAENTSDVIWVINADSLNFTYMSPSVYSLIGYSASEVSNKSVADIFEQQWLSNIVAKLNDRIKKFNNGDASERVKVYELQQICKNGSIIWVEMATTLITNNNNKVTEIIGVSRNIEQRKQAENQIHQKNIQLEELNATKDKFFSIIAHDLKSPFSSIVTLSDSLNNNIDNFPKENIKSFATAINYSAKHTFKLLENLLEWSKLQRENLKLNLRYLNFKSIVDEIFLLNSEMALRKRIEIQNTIDPDIFIHCDVEVTKSILRNLMSNALKFTNSNGLVIIKLEKFESYAEISVTDNGIGITPEKIPFLFNIDQDVSTYGTENETGTGLGLLLCKELVEKQGGKIWVKSILGKGSSFYFTIPQIFLPKQLFEEEQN